MWRRWACEEIAQSAREAELLAFGNTPPHRMVCGRRGQMRVAEKRFTLQWSITYEDGGEGGEQSTSAVT